MSHYNIDSCFFDEYNLHKRMEDVGVNEEKWEYDTDSDRIAAAVKSAEKTIYRFRLLAELERELECHLCAAGGHFVRDFGWI